MPVSKFMLAIMIGTIRSRLATSQQMQYSNEFAAREPLLSYATFFITGRWTSFCKLLLSIFTTQNEAIFLFLKSLSRSHFKRSIRTFSVTQLFGEIRKKYSLRLSIQLELQLPIFIARNCFVTLLSFIFVFGCCSFTMKVAGQVWAVDFRAQGERWGIAY